MSDKIKIFFVLLYYFAIVGIGFILFVPAFIPTFSPFIVFKIYGAFFILYSVLAIVYKIPVFNRHFIYKEIGFDTRFGSRHYFGFSIMIFLGIIFLYLGFFI